MQLPVASFWLPAASAVVTVRRTEILVQKRKLTLEMVCGTKVSFQVRN